MKKLSWDLAESTGGYAGKKKDLRRILKSCFQSLPKKSWILSRETEREQQRRRNPFANNELHVSYVSPDPNEHKGGQKRNSDYRNQRQNLTSDTDTLPYVWANRDRQARNKRHELIENMFSKSVGEPGRREEVGKKYCRTSLREDIRHSGVATFVNGLRPAVSDAVETVWEPKIHHHIFQKMRFTAFRVLCRSC
jgi:hypothetical protein